MADAVRKTAEIIQLLRDCPRITVRRAQEETGLSRRSVYRYVERIAHVLPIRIEDGVIVNDQ